MKQLIFSILFIFILTGCNEVQIISEIEEANYDKFGLEYRSESKMDTALGKLPRPLRILYKDGKFYGFDLDNKSVELPIVTETNIDLRGDIENYTKEVFFDVYRDRIYFISEGKIHLHDLANNGTRTLSDEINGNIKINQTICNNQYCDHQLEISGAHNDYLVMKASGYGENTIFNTKTGKRIGHSIVIGFDDSRGYKFWINEKGYRLIADSIGPPESFPISKDGRPGIRTIGTQNNEMKFYLDEIDEDYKPFMGKGPFLDGTELADAFFFTSQLHDFFDNEKPIFTLKTTLQSKFSLRNLYQINSDTIAIEINNGLLIFDINVKTAKFIEEESKIEELLALAILLSADPSDYQKRESCANDDFIDKLLFEKGYDFSFCLL